MKALLLTFLLLGSAKAIAAEPATSVSTDAIINLPIEGTWNLFTTEKGLRDMGYQQVLMSLKLDAHVHAERSINQQTENIDATLSSFDSQHMLSWRWTGDHACWSVLYFNAMGDEMTQIKWVDMCMEAEAVDLNKQSLLHRNLFDQLIRRYAPECHVCKEEREARDKH